MMQAQLSDRRRRQKQRTTWRIIEALSAPTLSLIILAAWQIGAPLLGLSDFVLPTPWQILRRIVIDFQLLASHAQTTLIEMVHGPGRSCRHGCDDYQSERDRLRSRATLT